MVKVNREGSVALLPRAKTNEPFHDVTSHARSILLTAANQPTDIRQLSRTFLHFVSILSPQQPSKDRAPPPSEVSHPAVRTQLRLGTEGWSGC